jgi:8-oxo-dGTP diphosphatase
MSEITNPPRVRIGVLIRKDGKVLLWKRLAKHWEGTRAPPGGHLEFGETPIEGAKRETLEETGITIKNCQIVGFTNDIYIDKHYITIIVIADYDRWEVQLLEPEKCEKWERIKRENFPSPAFLSMENVIKSWFHPFDNVIKVFLWG